MRGNGNGNSSRAYNLTVPMQDVRMCCLNNAAADVFRLSEILDKPCAVLTVLKEEEYF